MRDAVAETVAALGVSVRLSVVDRPGGRVRVRLRLAGPEDVLEEVRRSLAGAADTLPQSAAADDTP